MLVDGNAVQSCDTPLWSAAGHEITTIEGLGSIEHPHPLQQAFIDEQAAQCGYCINGIVMSAAALLAQEPRPERGGDRRRARAQPVPLRHARADPARDPRAAAALRETPAT